MKLVYSPLMGGLLHLIQRGGDWAELQPTQAPPRCTNVTADSSVASLPITVLLYNGPLLCGFNVPIRGLMQHSDGTENKVAGQLTKYKAENTICGVLCIWTPEQVIMPRP